MLTTCPFCNESVDDSAASCPFCGESTDISSGTRHYFRTYRFRECPLCAARPLLRSAVLCPKCQATLHQFSLEWGANLPRAEQLTRAARKLATASSQPGLSWKHEERKGRIRVSVELLAGLKGAFSFINLCQSAELLRGTECKHAGRLCKTSLPQNWIRCFFLARDEGDFPEQVRLFAFEDYDWRVEYLK